LTRSIDKWTREVVEEGEIDERLPIIARETNGKSSGKN
jgi:hypothetical protein